MYKEWLYLTTKWATKGLDRGEFKHWQTLTIQLNKDCQDCEEGSICETCHNCGVVFTGVETMIIKNIEMSLDANRTKTVN